MLDYGGDYVSHSIFENFGNSVTWEDSQLNVFDCGRHEHCSAYVDSIREDWKAGLNMHGINIKGCED